MKRFVIIFFLISMNSFADQLTINGKTYYSNGGGPGGADVPLETPPPDTGEAPQIKPYAPVESNYGEETTKPANEANQDSIQNENDRLKEQLRQVLQEENQRKMKDEDEQTIRAVDDKMERLKNRTLAKIEILQAEGINGDNNPRKIAEARDQIVEVWEEYGEKMGWDSATTKVETLQSLSTMNKIIIFDYLYKGDLKKAKKYLNSHKSEIWYTDLTEIYKKLHAGTVASY